MEKGLSPAPRGAGQVRGLLFVVLLLMGVVVSVSAQTAPIVTNLSDLGWQPFDGTRAVLVPFYPSYWRGYSFLGNQPWFVDCRPRSERGQQLSCPDLLQNPTSTPYYGVQTFAVD